MNETNHLFEGWCLSFFFLILRTNRASYREIKMSYQDSFDSKTSALKQVNNTVILSRVVFNCFRSNVFFLSWLCYTSDLFWKGEIVIIIFHSNYFVNVKWIKSESWKVRWEWFESSHFPTSTYLVLNLLEYWNLFYQTIGNISVGNYLKYIQLLKNVNF